MKETVLLAFALWPIVGILLFRRLPAGKALCLTYIAGWLILPNAWVLGGGAADFGGMTGSAIHSRCFLTKGVVIGLSALIAALVCKRGAFSRPRLKLIDLPIAIWTLVPLASGIFNGLPVADILIGFTYHLLAWAVPWVLGRAFLGSPAELLGAVRVFRDATLLYLPFALVEFVVGPGWHEWVYGVHPYTHDGGARYFAFRPMVFLEHGNQLGLWVGMAAVAAFWLWRTDAPESARQGRWIPTAILVVASVAFQSVGGILLMIGGLALLPIGRLRVGRLVLLCVAGLAILYLFVRSTDLVPVRIIARETAFGRKARGIIESWGRSSLGWRLNLEEESLRQAWQRPILGYARTNWWAPERNRRPWGLWILAFGQFGMLGLLSMTGSILLPVFALLRRKTSRQLRAPPWHGAGIIAVILLLSYADSLLNSTLPLWLVLVAGGLAGAQHAVGNASSPEVAGDAGAYET